MRVITYYRWSLVFPLALPVVLVPLSAYLEHLPSPLAFVVGLLVLSLLVGGVPYVILACGLWLWMRGKSEQAIHCASYVAPLAMIGVFALCYLPFSWTIYPEPLTFKWWRNELTGIGVWSIFIVGIGYAYVLFINGLFWFFKRVGIVVSAGVAPLVQSSANGFTNR